MDFNEKIMKNWLVSTRSDFHMHPELSNSEIQTTKKIKEILEDINVDVSEIDGSTGLVGLIRGKSNDKTIALRADIDALPIQELNEVPYKSKNDGVMHACGHDVHTTIMLGVAKYIQESGLFKEIKGNVKFLFQPAEENGTGAKIMINKGVLENPKVDSVFACHVSPDLPVGTVGVSKTLSHASADIFNIVIKGKGAHGGRPHEGIDPIVAGSSVVSAVQSIISRNLKPTDTAVITFGKFTAGKAVNVIPEKAYIGGTIRTFEKDVRDLVVERMKEILQGTEKTFQVTCSLEFEGNLPSSVNDEKTSSFLYSVAGDVLGSNNVRYIPPVTGSEDFAYFTIERPSAMIRLGCRNEEKGIIHMLHSPYFDIDEDVLFTGVRIFTEAIREFLA